MTNARSVAPGAAEDAPLRIGISSCLLGNEVRYDKGHKRDRFLTDQLGEFVEWVPVCPEVEVGLGLPRPAMRLVREGDSVRMVEIDSRKDHTASMERYSSRRVRELRKLELAGYVLKKDSPSCGAFRVKIYSESAMPKREGRGLFASTLFDAYPNLPIEDEGRLHDAALRENFIVRIFAYQRLQALFRSRWSNGSVVAFHTRQKLLLMAHSPTAYRELGRLVAGVKEMPRPEFRDRYVSGFMGALSRAATRGRNTNVLQHAVGYLKKILDAESRAELAGVIEDYRTGLVPLVVPITLTRHHARRFEIGYLNEQVYFQPHPKELMLRNHV